MWQPHNLVGILLPMSLMQIGRVHICVDNDCTMMECVGGASSLRGRRRIRLDLIPTSGWYEGEVGWGR